MTATTKDVVRSLRFSPYINGARFSLSIWDTHRTDSYGKSTLGYRLSIREGKKARILFEGEDFGCSPLHCIDSDATVAGIMSFLTLRPGDTDAEYFANYTPEQLEYCDQHAETLSCYIADRFGER